MFNLITKERKNLSNNEINRICKLKNKFWKFGINSQLKWFKQNVNINDLNNMIYFYDELVAYTSIRFNDKIQIKNSKKKTLLIDSVIIKNSFRRSGLSNILMEYNSYIIKKYNYCALLICDKKLYNFYKKFSWEKTAKKKYNINQSIKTNFLILKFKG